VLVTIVIRRVGGNVHCLHFGVSYWLKWSVSVPLLSSPMFRPNHKLLEVKRLFLG
jgi:hypothetical protein